MENDEWKILLLSYHIPASKKTPTVWAGVLLITSSNENYFFFLAAFFTVFLTTFLTVFFTVFLTVFLTAFLTAFFFATGMNNHLLVPSKKLR
jgi:hypothetical protein